MVKSIQDSRVKDAVLKDQDQKITGTYNDGRKFEAAYTEQQGKDLFNLLQENKVPARVDPRGQSVLVQILIQLSPSPCSCCSSSSCSRCRVAATA